MTLKELREEKLLTQKELCRLTGLPYNTYRHYEYGDTFPGKKDRYLNLECSFHLGCWNRISIWTAIERLLSFLASNL